MNIWMMLHLLKSALIVNFGLSTRDMICIRIVRAGESNAQLMGRESCALPINQGWVHLAASSKTMVFRNQPPAR
jgi:hypothetical protein